MELIDIYTNDLDTYTLGEFVVENLAREEVYFKTVGEYYEYIAEKIGLSIEEIVDTLNEHCRPTEEFYEKMEDVFEIPRKHTEFFQKRKDKAEEKRLAQKERKRRGKGFYSDEMWLKRGQDWNRRMNMIGRIMDKHEHTMSLHDLHKKIAKITGLNISTARGFRKCCIARRGLVKKYGVMDTTIQNAGMLLRNGYSIDRVYAYLGMSKNTVKRIKSDMGLDKD